MRGLVALLLCWVWAWHAHASDDVAAFVGLPVADVVLQSPEGGAPSESLEPLLRTESGAPLDLATVRLDLTTLFQVGEFAAVEADAQPWALLDAQGEPIPAVLLTFFLYPAPVLDHVRVQGHRAFTDREFLEAAALTPGQVYYSELEDTLVETRVRSWLHRQGYTQAGVSIRTEETGKNNLDVIIEVSEGPPNLLERLSFAGDLERLPVGRENRRLIRWARREGVVEGEPFAPEAISRAQYALRARLASMQRGLFRRRYGWIGARVSPAIVDTGEAKRVTFTIEPGPRLQLQASGVLWAERKSAAALGIDERLRLTRGFLDEAPTRVDEWFQLRGYTDAASEVTLTQSDDNTTETLDISIQTGPRHRLRTGGFLEWLGVDFVGNESVSDSDLMAVLDQTSDDVIRKDWYSEAELTRGLEATADLYRARGHLTASLTITETKERAYGWPPVRWLLAPVRFVLRRPAPRLVIPTIEVVEGPLTRLYEVQISGTADDVPLDFVLPIQEELEGQPYSPQKLEVLARAIVEAHGAAGYLDADARVVSREVGPNEVASTIEVTSGESVRLRSIVTKGLRFTRPQTVRREVELSLGDQVTPAELDRTRANLYDLQTFRTVETTLLGDEAARDLVVSVVERPRWGFEVGAGLSTDQGIRTFGRATRRNLWGTAHRADLIGQIGLDYRSDSIRDWVPNLTEPELRAALQYTAPRFPTRRQELVLDLLFRERRQERTWRMARSGAGAALDTRFGARTRLRTAARLEYRQFQEVEIGALLDGEPWLALVDPLDPDPTGIPRLQESLTALLVHDLRDDPVQPRSGVLFSTNTELVPGMDWGTEAPAARFAKAESRLSAYIPLVGFTLNLTGEGGHGRTLTEGTTIPLEDRYVLGGTGSLRGFARDAVGPRNVTSRVDVDWPSAISPVLEYSTRDSPERWVPTGGDTIAVGTVELLMPLPALGLPGWQGYSAAIFADVGNTWLLSTDARATSERERYLGVSPALRYGVGGGLRVATPVGPLQLDIASNIQAASASGRSKAFLRDDWEESPLRAHLTLGALF